MSQSSVAVAPSQSIMAVLTIQSLLKNDVLLATLSSEKNERFILLGRGENENKHKKMPSLAEVAILTVRNAVEAMITIDRKGRIEGFNPAAERMFGYTAAEIIGQNVHLLLPTPHKERHEQYVCAYMATGIRRMNWSHQPLTALRKDGTVVRVDMTISEAVLEGIGRLFTSTMRVANEKPPSLLDATTDAILTVDHSGRVLTMNRATEQMFGYLHIELIGYHVHRLMCAPSAVARTSVCAYATFGHALFGCTREIKVFRQNGTAFPVELVVSVNAAEPYYVVTLRDIGQRLLDRRLLVEATSVRTAFLARVSHELRTPLNGVVGVARFLQETVLSDEQREAVTIIVQSGETLVNRVNEILDFSRIDAGHLSLEHHPFELSTTVESAVSLLVTTARVPLYIHIDRTVEVLGDAGRLQQVVVNLVGNALKFTTTGSVHLTVTTIAVGSRLRIRLSVRDTGCGIPAGLDPMDLFLPFRQADESTTRQFGGTGLGLSIVWELVRRMGGEVGAHRESVGSTFWCTLELEQGGACVESRSCYDRALLLVRDSVLEGILRDYVSSSCTVVTNTMPADLLKGSLVVIGDKHCDMAQIRALYPHAQLVGLRPPSCFSTSPVRSTVMGCWLPWPVQRTFLQTLLKKVTAEPLPRSLTDVSTGLVLLAEDNSINQKVVQMQLRKLGYRADIANDGKEVLQRLRERSTYKLILMDCHMPNMDGYECARAVRKLPMPYGQIRIVALTGGVSEWDRQRCLECGMNDFLAKPLRTEELARVVKESTLRS